MSINKIQELLLGALFVAPTNAHAITQVSNIYFVKQCTACKTKADINNDIPVKYLVLCYTNGNEVFFPLADNPVMALSDEELKVESSKDNLSASLKSLSRFYFLENTPSTNIGQHNKDIAAQEVPTISNGHIFLRHLPAGTHIRIYTLSGQQLAEKRIPNSGDMEIDMTIYPKGTYIVSMPQGQLKIMNK